MCRHWAGPTALLLPRQISEAGAPSQDQAGLQGIEAVGLRLSWVPGHGKLGSVSCGRRSWAHPGVSQPQTPSLNLLSAQLAQVSPLRAAGKKGLLRSSCSTWPVNSPSSRDPQAPCFPHGCSRPGPCGTTSLLPAPTWPAAQAAVRAHTHAHAHARAHTHTNAKGQGVSFLTPTIIQAFSFECSEPYDHGMLSHQELPGEPFSVVESLL